MNYNPQDIEPKWRKYWQDNQTYRVENGGSKPKYYVLDMFPYPSGSGLHVGHPLGYVASDIFARYKRLKGFNVLHPMGYDAFGLPAEQYAMQTGVHPVVTTEKAIATYRGQLDNLGLSFDWSREVRTCDSSYYKFTQEIFLLLFQAYYDNDSNKAEPIDKLTTIFSEEGNANIKAASSQETVFTAAEWLAFTPKEQDDILMNYRLAYRKVAFVNWCEELGTVLANDEIKDGVSERGGYPVIQKPMLQWALRITAYGERLLTGLDTVQFSEALKTQQRNWIGKSEGALINFKVNDNTITVFTTRPDTIFGSTFMVLAPEHDLVANITSAEQKAEVEKYLAYVNTRTERDRQTDKRITGAWTGAYAINPFNGAQIPVWISEYVLAGYGTGAIMGVPAHDERDERFAKHFQLPIIKVIEQPEGASIEDKSGIMINSDLLNGLDCKTAIAKILDEIESRQFGERKVNFRLRDANFSRQRYWGEPFPVAYDADGVTHIDTVLPVELPELQNYTPTADGKAPLARATEWLTTPEGWTRETDTMPGFAGSSWYFLRYMDAQNPNELVSAEAVNYWQDVDLYVGGSEHAVGHLLYSRFWHKVLFDFGRVPTEEPFKRLVNQGMIQGVIEYMCLKKDKTADGKAYFISADLEAAKDRENIALIPVHIDFVKYQGESYTYLDADGIAQFKAWRPDYADAIIETNAEGRFVTISEVGKMSKRYFNVVNPDDVVAEYGADAFRMYEMFLGPLEMSKPWDTRNIKGVFRFLQGFWNLYFDKDGNFTIHDEAPSRDELKVLHTAIKKVSEDLEKLSMNTCVSAMMIAVNELRTLTCRKRAILEPLAVLIAPFAPHIAEELWHLLGNTGSVNDATYPAFQEEFLTSDVITYPVSINGKRRTELEFPAETDTETIKAAVLANEIVLKWLEGKAPKNVIIVPKRMVNVVI